MKTVLLTLLILAAASASAAAQGGTGALDISVRTGSRLPVPRFMQFIRSA
jgi:hypothetical protein